MLCWRDPTKLNNKQWGGGEIGPSMVGKTLKLDFFQVAVCTFLFLFNVYCLLCLTVVEELKNIEFFLINFQCLMYAVGSLSQLLGSMSKSAMGFYVWKCGRYEADYYSNSRMDYFFYDYEYYDYVQRLVKHFKICKKKIVFRGTQSIATGPILIFLSCNIRQIRENVFLSGQRLSYNTLPV